MADEHDSGHPTVSRRDSVSRAGRVGDAIGRPKEAMLISEPQRTFEGVQEDLLRMTGRLEYMGERPDLESIFPSLELDTNSLGDSLVRISR